MESVTTMEHKKKLMKSISCNNYEGTECADEHEEDSNSNPNNKLDQPLFSKQVSSITSIERSSMEIDQKCSSPVHDNQDDQLKSAKAEMGEVREENEKLKLTLSKIMKDYHSLQMHFDKIIQQDAPKKSLDTIFGTKRELIPEEEPELVSLSLGRFQSKKKDINYLNKGEADSNNMGKLDHDQQGLALGLDCKFDQSSAGLIKKGNNIGSPESSLNESNEETTTEEGLPTSKRVKTGKSGEDEISQQSPPKKARVSIRAICNTATMNDGCQWRKYGQKIAKGNPCPRAYYRCTVSSSCPVRKHVQRCAQDMSILITTYEGTHNHPLPVSATAMASTTSAAASMLKSASSTSQSGLGTTTTSSNLHGLNFTQSPSLRHPFYFTNPTISTNQSHPTVTLDLTAPTTASHYNRTSSLSSSYLYSSQKYLPTHLDFSSASSNNRNIIGSSYFNTQQIQQQSHQPYTIEAATKEITSNPRFRSALAAAITSFVGNAREKTNSAGESSAFALNLSHSSNGIGCASSYLNRPNASNSQEGNLTLFPSLLQLSASKKPCVSPIDEGDNIYVD